MIQRWLLWWWARRDQPIEFSFPSALRTAKRVLILMPASNEALRLSEVFLSRVPRVFPKTTEVTLLYPPKAMVARFYKPYGFKSVVPEAGQVGWWGIPRRKFLKDFCAKPYDVMITLNQAPNVFYGAVAVHSRTPVRLGLRGGMGQPFVNVELCHDREKADIKTEFILFIEMIRRLAVPQAAEALDAKKEPHTSTT